MTIEQTHDTAASFNYDSTHEAADEDLERVLIAGAAYDAYLHLPKLLEPNDHHLLIELCKDLEAAESPRYQFVAYSAMAEAALIADDLTVTARSEMIDEAEAFLIRAISLQYVRDQEKEKYEEGLGVDTYRYLMHYAYLPVLREITEGRVARDTLNTAYDSGLKVAAENILETARWPKDSPMRSVHEGLDYENKITLGINRKRYPRFIAMPTFARADSGVAEEERTHDVQVFQLKKGQIRRTTPIESKKKTNDGTYKRYTEVAVVSGMRHLTTSYNNMPAQMTYLLLKERYGSASEQELGELDTITNMLTHIARHHASRLAEVPKHCRDIGRCDAFPGWKEAFQYVRPIKPSLSKRKSRAWQLSQKTCAA